MAMIDDDHARANRRCVIHLHRADAEHLLAGARHESMKEQLRLAVRDLDEAEQWITWPGLEQRPELLEIADHILELAAWRISTVREALDLYGSEGPSLGQSPSC